MPRLTLKEQLEALLNSEEGAPLRAAIEAKAIEQVLNDAVAQGIINPEQGEQVRAIKCRPL